MRVDIPATVSLVGLIIRWLSITLAIPLLLALAYGEPLRPFAAPLALGVVIGLLLERVGGRRQDDVGPREAFLVVAAGWLVAAIVGAAPFMMESRVALGPLDALFESMSGFTTTGASVITDLDAQTRSLLFWRSLTQWIGGMGIIVLAIAILRPTGSGGRALFEREAPGPDVEKITPRLRDTALRLWGVYIALSAILAVSLLLIGRLRPDGGMGLFAAVTHSFTTLSTGGFSPEARSIETFNGATQAVIALFMLAGGGSFALWYRLGRGRWRAALADGELRTYLSIIAVGTVAVALALVISDQEDGGGALGRAAFQVISIVTTTGYASADFATWTAFALLILVALMFVGGCSGSTSGSLKTIRFRLALAGARRDVETAVHPEKILPVRVMGRPVREAAVRGATAFAGLYLASFAVGALAILAFATLAGNDLSAFDAVVASASSIGNVGPGVGEAGPMGSYAAYPAGAKATMIVLMWAGRLELLPVLVLLTRAYWLR